MKLIGLLLIVCTGIGCGVGATRRLRRRVQLLEQLARLAELLAERLHGTAAPLPVLLAELAQCEELAALPFWDTLPMASGRDARAETVARGIHELGLHTEEGRTLREFVSGWGEADLAGEIARDRRYAAQFHRLADTARAQAEQRGRVYLTLGICGGGAAALLLC